MAEGKKCWPCIPRVSGLIPGTRNLKVVNMDDKFMDSQKSYKTSFRCQVVRADIYEYVHVVRLIRKSVCVKNILLQRVID